MKFKFYIKRSVKKLATAGQGEGHKRTQKFGHHLWMLPRSLNGACSFNPLS